jgi:hypothetical protein
MQYFSNFLNTKQKINNINILNNIEIHKCYEFNNKFFFISPLNTLINFYTYNLITKIKKLQLVYNLFKFISNINLFFLIHCFKLNNTKLFFNKNKSYAILEIVKAKIKIIFYKFFTFKNNKNFLINLIINKKLFFKKILITYKNLLYQLMLNNKKIIKKNLILFKYINKLNNFKNNKIVIFLNKRLFYYLNLLYNPKKYLQNNKNLINNKFRILLIKKILKINLINLLKNKINFSLNNNLPRKYKLLK